MTTADCSRVEHGARCLWLDGHQGPHEFDKDRQIAFLDALVAAAQARAADAEKQLAAARAALRAFVDDDECRYDHHGNCQTHLIDQPCSVANARAILTPAADAGGREDVDG